MASLQNVGGGLFFYPIKGMKTVSLFLYLCQAVYFAAVLKPISPPAMYNYSAYLQFSLPSQVEKALASRI